MLGMQHGQTRISETFGHEGHFTRHRCASKWAEAGNYPTYMGAN